MHEHRLIPLRQHGVILLPDQKTGQNTCGYGLFSGPWLSGREGQTPAGGQQCGEPTDAQLPAWVELPGYSTGSKSPGGALQTEVPEFARQRPREARERWRWQRAGQHICVRRAPAGAS